MEKDLAIKIFNEFLDSFGLNPTNLSKEVNVSRQGLYDIVNPNKPKVGISKNLARKISEKYPVNEAYLLTGIGNLLITNDTKKEVGPVLVELKEKTYPNQLAVKVVSSKARAGYSEAYYSDEYLEDMPTILIEADEPHKGRYLAFEVDGDSMEPDYLPGDVVICREVQRSNWQYKLHIDDWDFVIAHGTQGIMLKEITRHNTDTGEIVCHSINTDMHPDFILNLKEVAYLYNVVEHRRSGKGKRRITL